MAAGPLEVKIDKLIHGGQGIGTLPDGKKAMLWNVLPGETVSFTPRKSRSSYVEGVAEYVADPSPDRAEPLDELYLSTSPWQMMRYEAENKYKKDILVETLERGGVEVDSEMDWIAPVDP
jgi:23S rRNA (uracil1939-C5)-methyltransferase